MYLVLVVIIIASMKWAARVALDKQGTVKGTTSSLFLGNKEPVVAPAQATHKGQKTVFTAYTKGKNIV